MSRDLTMDPNQLPPGMFTPERPSGSNANDPNNTVRLDETHVVLSRLAFFRDGDPLR